MFVLTAAQHWHVTCEMYGSRISLFTACTLLFTLRVYYSFDNPYLVILSILFGTRSMFKFVACHTLTPSVLEFLMHLLDMFTFCSMLDNGFMTNNSDYFTGVASQITVVLVCFLFALQIFVYKVDQTL